MLTLKYRENIKIAFVTIVLALMLLAEPVLAKKARTRSSKPSRGSQKSRQVKKTSAAPKVQRSSNAGKTRTKSTAPSRATRSRTGLSASGLPGRDSSRRTVKPRVRQPSTAAGRHQSSRITYSRQPRRVTPSRTTAPQPKIARRSSGGGKPARLSPSPGKQAAISSSNRISSGKTSRIGSSIGEKKSPVTTTQKRATVSPSNRISLGKTSRIGSSIGEKKSPVTAIGKFVRRSKPKIGTAKTTESNGSKTLRKSKSIVKRPERRAETSRKSYRPRKQAALKSNNRTSFRRRSLLTRPSNEKSQHIRPSNEKSQHIRPSNEKSQHIRPSNEKSQHIRIEGTKASSKSRPTLSRRRKMIDGNHKHRRRKERSSRPAYRERTSVVRDTHQHEHVYVDRHHRIHRRIVRPTFRFGVRYNWGPYWTFRYVYPYYHRKYVFISLGGYWPIGYRYARYYWYGCHPYYWYGYYPIAREVTDDTYNYYTYNYYYDDDTAAFESSQATGDIKPVDHNTFADVREKLAQQAAEEPDEATLADSYFEDAVKAFEAGDYDTAAEMFAKAIELAPDDMVLPFAYSQALFANEKYAEAAEVLRAALAKVSPEKEGVFYPRGLYAEDDILFEQIDQLAEKADLYSFDADLQLLLGYHLLGIGEIDEAVEPLRQASRDLENAASATVLLNLLEKIRTEKPQSNGR